MADKFRITKGWAQRFAAEKIDIPTLLHRAALPAHLFDQEKIFVTTAQIFSLWRAVAELVRDPAFGLKLGAELRFERSHPVAIAGVCSRNFGDALQRLARYKQLTCPEEIRVRRKAQESSIEFHFIEAKETEPDIMVDVGLSWILNIARRGSDGAIEPLRLDLTRPAQHRALLEKHFGCPIKFKADRNALIFRSADLDRPFATHNEELVAALETHLESDLKSRQSTTKIGDQVKTAIQRSLAGRRPTLQGIAKELGLSSRTLQRRLTGAQLSFQQLIDDARRELARHYLKQRAIELNEAAFLLGYQDANSFFRAFQKWEGSTPTAWRAQIWNE